MIIMTSAKTSSKAKTSKLLYISLSALFAAMCYILTAFVHIPTIKGYVHVGDAVIFVAACLLPKPYAMCSAAIGASLSDALSGYWIWVPATIVIKALTVLAFTSKKQKIICARNIIALIPALILCVGGYGLYSGVFIFHSLPAGFLDAPANAFQTIASGALFILASFAVDRSQIRKNTGL